MKFIICLNRELSINDRMIIICWLLILALASFNVYSFITRGAIAGQEMVELIAIYALILALTLWSIKRKTIKCINKPELRFKRYRK